MCKSEFNRRSSRRETHKRVFCEASGFHRWICAHSGVPSRQSGGKIQGEESSWRLTGCLEQLESREGLVPLFKAAICISQAHPGSSPLLIKVTWLVTAATSTKSFYSGTNLVFDSVVERWCVHPTKQALSPFVHILGRNTPYCSFN